MIDLSTLVLLDPNGTEYKRECEIREATAKAVAQRCVEICKEQQSEPECHERATYCADAIAAEFGLDQTGEPS